MTNLDGSVFGKVADTYHDARPRTPAATMAWLTDGQIHDALDLAAGTGRFTELLQTRTPRIAHVHAVEPDQRMLGELRLRCPDALAQSGRAEAIPLPDDSVDLVVAADAWQWFDQPTATTEIARVLRPGGTLGVVWNERDTREHWVATLAGLLPHGHWPANPPGQFTLPLHAPFTPPERYEQISTWTVTPQTLLVSLRTYSIVLSLPDDEANAWLAAAQTYLRDVLAGRSVVDVPVRTVAYRTRLREG